MPARRYSHIFGTKYSRRALGLQKQYKRVSNVQIVVDAARWKQQSGEDGGCEGEDEQVTRDKPRFGINHLPF